MSPHDNALPTGEVLAATPPPFSPEVLITQASPAGWLTVVLVVAAAAYLYGVHRLRARGDHWPRARTALFCLAGLGLIAAVTVTGLEAYDTTLLSAHMVQHMVLTMVAPIFLALGTPVTLALRTLPRGGRRALLAVLHSRVVKVFTFPLVAFGIFVINPFALYFTDLYRLSLEHAWVHEWVHAHFLITGCLFFWPLVGRDPLPNRWPYPGRALLMLLSVPFHTVLGLTVMQSTTLLGGDWYPSLNLDWADPYADQRLAGGILWAGGEFVTVCMLGVLLAQWIRDSEREARRVDRALDRAEAEQARAEQRAEAEQAGAEQRAETGQGSNGQQAGGAADVPEAPSIIWPGDAEPSDADGAALQRPGRDPRADAAGGGHPPGR